MATLPSSRPLDAMIEVMYLLRVRQRAGVGKLSFSTPMGINDISIGRIKLFSCSSMATLEIRGFDLHNRIALGLH